MIHARYPTLVCGGETETGEDADEEGGGYDGVLCCSGVASVQTVA
jgi:hypothetical protein